MDNLRLLLFILGMLGIALIYFWSIFSQQKQERKKTAHQAEPEITLSNFHEDMSLQVDKEPLVSLSGLTDGELDLKPGSSADAGADLPDIQAGGEEAADLFPQENANSDTGQEAPLALHITASPTQPFSGTALLRALELVEMEYGEMSIFHHYGTGEMKPAKALFSLANMYEPGSFNLDNIEQESIRGLTLFLRMPASSGAQIAFELMLSTAQRLADALGGEVCGAGRKLLDEREIAEMRNTMMTPSSDR